MNSRKMPETPLSPDFIKVSYDKNGNPLAVRPVEMKVQENDAVVQSNGHTIKPIPQPIQEWLSLISKNIIALKRDVENTNAGYSQVVAEVKQMNAPKINLVPILNSIESANSRIDGLSEKINQTNMQFNVTNQQLGDQKALYSFLAEQVNVMNEIIASVAKEFSNHQTISRQLGEKIEMLNEQLNGNFITIKKILQDMDLTNSETNQKFVHIDERIAAMHRQLASSVERTEGNVVALNGVIGEIAKKMQSLETSNFETKVEIGNSIKSLYANFTETDQDTRNHMENALEKTKQELLNAIEQNKIDRELLIQEIVERSAKRMRNLVKKTKVGIKIKVKKSKHGKAKQRKVKHKVGKHRKIQKTAKRKLAGKVKKINKNILAKKLMRADIGNYPSAVIVTERKMQRIGRAVFDVSKKMNKNIVMIMQDKMNE